MLDCRILSQGKGWKRCCLAHGEWWEAACYGNRTAGAVLGRESPSQVPVCWALPGEVVSHHRTVPHGVLQAGLAPIALALGGSFPPPETGRWDQHTLSLAGARHWKATGLNV